MIQILIMKFMLVFGLGIWLLIAARNNYLDPETNITLLTNMFQMKNLQDKDLGKGLLRRAWKSGKSVKWILKSIVLIQTSISLCLLVSAILFIFAFNKVEVYSLGLELANVGLIGFNSLWLSFLCGGLWFGYWIYMSHVQTTHLILFLIGFMSLILINLL